MLTVSAAWLTKRFDCTLEHIQNSCGGKCCRHTITWPATSYPNNVCGHLGEAGCKLSTDERPITCMLFPIIPNKDNKLVLWQRGMFKTSMCKDAFGNGPMIFDAMKTGLIAVFGETQFYRVRQDIVAGRDSYFIMSEKITHDYYQAITDEENNRNPSPRT